MSAPVLSIVTITYKDPKGFQETLESLQPLLNSKISFEHIVVDSSKEESAAALGSISKTAWPLVYISQSPAGIYAAMNAGIQVAKGQFVWFLNGGDKLLSISKLEMFLETFDKNPNIDIVCGGCDFLVNGKYLKSRFPRDTFLASIIGKDSLPHQAMFYRKSALTDVGPFSTDYKIAGDYEHHFRCYLKGKKALCLKTTVVACDASGKSFTDWKLSITEGLKIGQTLKGQLPAHLYWRHSLGCRAEMLRMRLLSLVRA